MNKEIERKYLVFDLPKIEEEENLNKVQERTFIQGYIITNEDSEVRIRKVVDADENDPELEVKKGVGLSRDPYKIVLNEDQLRELWPSTSGNRIKKRRYDLEYGSYLIEVDKYFGSLNPLMVAEVEFETEREAENFKPPYWFSFEVTRESEYKNKYLATHGLPFSFHQYQEEFQNSF